MAVVVYGSIAVEWVELKVTGIDAKSHFALLHPTRISNYDQAHIGKVRYAVQECSCVVGRRIHIVGLSLGALFTGGHDGLFHLIATTWRRRGQARGVLCDCSVVGVVVFLFVTHDLTVQTCEPVVIGLVWTSVLAVIEKHAAHLIDGIGRDGKCHAIGMIAAESVVLELLSTDADLVPGRDSCIGTFRFFLFSFVVDHSLLLTGDVGAAAYDLVDQLYYLCAGQDLPHLAVDID